MAIFFNYSYHTPSFQKKYNTFSKNSSYLNQLFISFLNIYDKYDEQF